MSNCLKKLNFPVKLLKTVFVANDNWRQAPGLDLLHHKCECLNVRPVGKCMCVWKGCHPH